MLLPKLPFLAAMLAIASAVPSPAIRERGVTPEVSKLDNIVVKKDVVDLDKIVVKKDAVNIDKSVVKKDSVDRGMSIAKKDIAGLEKRDQGSCWIHYWHGSGVYAIWYFRLDTWGEWDDDWGAGLLDNIRGKCYAWDYVWEWQFYYDEGPPPTWGHATFEISGAFVTPNYQCVADAVAAASWNWGPVTAQIDAAGSKWW